MNIPLTRAPSCYQFRLPTINSRNIPSMYLQMRVHRQIRCSSTDNGTGNVTELPTNSNFSGWFVESNGSKKSNHSNSKPILRGMIGGGVILILAGLTFGVISITKSASVSKQKMEPLVTTQQEESLLSADQNDNRTIDDRHLEGTTDEISIFHTPSEPVALKVLVPAVLDQVQGNALAALQVLKVVEGSAQPGDICTRREYARWLVSASSALSRNTLSKVYPAMYIENVTELAFDDITPQDPDFSSIQGLAEAGLIASKLSRNDINPSDHDKSFMNFSPESPLSRQDLVSWKMSLERRLLPVADRTILQQCSGFIDIDKISPDAWPALIADLSKGDQGIVSLAFGYTRLFQPDKPVTKAQAAVAIACSEASDIVSEELARIEADYIAEKAVAAHTSLMDQVEKEINANFENVFLLEMEKIATVENMTEDVKQELENLKAEREKENIKLMEERAPVDSEMEVFSNLRHEVDEQLQSIMSNKVEILNEKEKLKKLLTNVEHENQEIARLQHELEVERKALSMARSWAEEEAKRAKEQAKVLEEARDHWKSQGMKIVVDQDLREEANAGFTWLSAGSEFSVQETKNRAQNLVDKLKPMTTDIKGKSKETIDRIIEKVLLLISQLKEWTSQAVEKVTLKFKT